MNMQRTIFTGTFWMPGDKFQMVQEAIKRVQNLNVAIGEIQPEAGKTPPTAFRLNDFTTVP